MIIRNARIVLPERITERSAIVIEDGRFGRILGGEGRNPTGSGNEINLDGCTLFPGFIDVHIHGAVGVDVMDATTEDLHRVSLFLAAQGICGWLPTLVPASDRNYTSAVSAIGQSMTSQNSGECRILGFHYEGPFVNSAQCGALHGEYFKSFTGPADIDSLPLTQVRDAIKMITVAPEIEGGVELVRELSAKGWVVSLGHTRATPAVLDQAFKAGAGHLTHFMNAMPQLHHRSPGPVGWGLSRDDVTCDIIADGVHLDPLVLRLVLKVKSSDRLMLISDAIAAAGLGDGDYHIWGETISVVDGRTRNAHGNIAGSVITLLDAVRMMLSLGASEVEVARMAATNPARLLGIDQSCGSIEEGKRADLVALDREGNVRLTMIGGKVAVAAV